MAITNKLTAIGDAIRVKTGGTAKLTLDQMVTEIGNISGGGYPEDDLIQNTLVNLSYDTITSVPEYAFFYSPNLETVSLPKASSIGAYAFTGSPKLREIYLPELLSLGTNCFQICTSLKKVDLPKVMSIPNYAFKGCSALDTLVIRKTGTTLSMSSQSIVDTAIAKGNGYIYVPDDLVDTYKTATTWSTYADQIKPLSEYVEVS